MAKKFGERALNSTTYVDETITQALEETTTASSVVHPLPAAPAEEPAVTSKSELLQEVETSATGTPAKSRVGEGGYKNTRSKNSEKVAEPEVEKTIGLNIHLPKSLYKRLSNMKFDMDGESLKSLGIAAIEEFLKKNGY